LAGYGEKAMTSCSVIHGSFWMAISFPEDVARADIENASVS
jgi:choline kinase